MNHSIKRDFKIVVIFLISLILFKVFFILQFDNIVSCLFYVNLHIHVMSYLKFNMHKLVHSAFNYWYPAVLWFVLLIIIMKKVLLRQIFLSLLHDFHHNVQICMCYTPTIYFIVLFSGSVDASDLYNYESILMRMALVCKSFGHKTK